MKSEKSKIKNTKFNVEKSFKTKVTTTGSTRSELLHYNNKRVTIILLMATQQVPKEEQTIATPTKDK
uniref:Putative ovule protein n=1 Tax=Solanum chacoense TaxID=4108 RepID=A0A0V0HE34_SOLCH